MNLYPLKAALHFLAAFCATVVAAGVNEPTSTWQWTLLLTGAFGSGTVALKGYLSDATNQPRNDG